MVGQGKQTSAERRRERAAAARKAAARRSHRLRLQAGAAAAAVLLVGGGAYGAITVVKNHHGSAKPALDAAFSPAPTPNQAGAPPGKANCVYVNTPGAETGGKKVTPPPSVAEAVAPYYAEVLTDHGTVEIELDSKAAPCAVNSFVSLANQGFYDNTICHRLLDQAEQQLTYAVLQCGDPTGTGKGGPGYKFADENLTGAKYSKGVIAMANAGPNTNGSQFFMMFKDSSFDPAYTPFGRILAGLDVIEGIARGGVDVNSATGSNDVPKTKTTIQKVTISTTPPSGVSTAPPQASSTPTPIGTSAGTTSPGTAGAGTITGTAGPRATGTAIPNKGSSTTPKNLGPATPKP